MLRVLCAKTLGCRDFTGKIESAGVVIDWGYIHTVKALVRPVLDGEKKRKFFRRRRRMDSYSYIVMPKAILLSKVASKHLNSLPRKREAEF